METSDDHGSGSSVSSRGQNYSTTGDAQESSLNAQYQRVLSDANLVASLLNQYWSAELMRNYGLSFDVPDRFEYYFSTGNGPCGGPRQDLPNNAYYCSQNGNEYVAFDVNWFVEYLGRFPGDAVTFLALAHEWGHAVQDTWVEQQPGIDTWNPAYAKELNADCLAGVFLNDAVDSGAIIEEEGDAEAIYQQLFEIGSGEWFNPGDHGTSEQRQRAFTDGLMRDVTYCRTYY